MNPEKTIGSLVFVLALTAVGHAFSPQALPAPTFPTLPSSWKLPDLRCDKNNIGRPIKIEGLSVATCTSSGWGFDFEQQGGQPDW